MYEVRAQTSYTVAIAQVRYGNAIPLRPVGRVRARCAVTNPDQFSVDVLFRHIPELSG